MKKGFTMVKENNKEEVSAQKAEDCACGPDCKCGCQDGKECSCGKKCGCCCCGSVFARILVLVLIFFAGMGFDAFLRGACFGPCPAKGPRPLPAPMAQAPRFSFNPNAFTSYTDDAGNIVIVVNAGEESAKPGCNCGVKGKCGCTEGKCGCNADKCNCSEGKCGCNAPDGHCGAHRHFDPHHGESATPEGEPVPPMPAPEAVN